MAHKIEKKVKSVKVKKEVYTDASMTRRLLAYFIDWYVGGLAVSFPISMIAQKLYGTMLRQDIMHFDKPYGLYAGLAGLIFAFLYFVIVPMFVWKGQTFGKRICKIKIVNKDDTCVSWESMILRQVVGIIFVENALVTASAIWHQVATIAFGVDFVTPFKYLGMALVLVSSLLVLFGKEHRAIHDFIGNTKVVNM